ncbi:taste receptor type 2 member 129-like [Pangasianodon hypophthalmus]|uniref:taste receptor type 2 member 129-like n=1 Tax=Pangasianodon hypophthalmus TaxID=310915 RepID=UPI0023070C05|nr:taste receptor type 2 member 129-like [Pangasianodon hypophthalmus]
MDSLTFAVVNIPVSIISIIMNIFLLFCMFFPQQGTERLKQPLNILLGTLVGCNFTLQVCIFVYTIMESDLLWSSNIGYSVIIEIILFTMRTSVTSSLWLNVFYYCQIVPAQCSVFIFLKKNIRFFIYSALIADKIFFMLGFSEGIALTAARLELYDLYEYDFNITYTIQWDEAHAKMDTLYFMFRVDTWLRFSYLLLCLFVMSTSSCATILYLWKHMKSMEGSSSSFSSPRLQRQMRVTITGIIQTFLYFLCLVWILVRELLVFVFYLSLDLNGHICCSVVGLYSFGSTINLCVGQTIFRQRVIEVWQKFLKIAMLLSK